MKSGHRLKLSGMLISIASLVLTAISPASADMLAEEVSAAIQTHPEIASLNFQAGAARSQIGQAFAGYLPTLDARAAGGFENIDNPATRARVGDDDDLDPTELRLILKQNVFKGFGTRSHMESARSGYRAATLEVMDGGERVGLEAVQAYVNILRSQGLVALAQQNLQIHRGLLDLVKRRVEQKVGRSSEVNEAQARVREAEAEVFQARGTLENARSVYKTVVGSDPGILDQPDVPGEMVSPKVDQLVSEALEENPAIVRAQALVARAEADVRRTKSSFWPNLDLELSAKNDDDLDGTPGDYDGYKAMAIVSYNLFNGGADRHRLKESLLLLRQAKSDLELAQRRVAEAVKVSRNDLRVSRLRLKSFEAQVRENERVQKAFADQFKVGKRTLLDLLDTQRELFVSKSNVISETHEETFAVYRVLAAQGRLLKTLGVKVPEPPGAPQLQVQDYLR